MRRSPAVATSLLKALDVLTVVARSAEGATMRVLTERTKLPRTTVLRILRTYESYGLVKRDKHAFATTQDFHDWTARDHHVVIRNRYRKLLEKLCSRVNELVTLGVCEGGRLLLLDNVESTQTIRAHATPTTRLPLEITAMGKLILGQRPDLLARVRSPAVLAAVARARETGVGWNLEESEPGHISMAVWAGPPSPTAPLIAIGWPAFRFTERAGTRALQAIREELRDLPE